MSNGPRLLCVMGSGETAPTMRGVHADLLDRVGSLSGEAVMLDTPYGFQENADELNERTRDYFGKNVGHPVELVSWRHRDLDPVATDRALERIRSARYVFAGPGSPTYALRQWRGTGLPDALHAVLRRGGCVTFASAAALTLGVATIPVYEVYKAGLPAAWDDGLDLFSVTGLCAAVIPHYDNAEGGTHDTRYCYLGERRLRALEPDLPDEAFVFGVDEHTAAVLDLDRRTVEISGRGGLTIRRDGHQVVFGTGSTVSFEDIADAAGGAGGSGRRATTSSGAAATVAEGGGTASAAAQDTERAVDPLTAAARELDERQRTAIGNRDVDTAVACVLELEQALQDWSADTLTGDQVDRARDLLRGMVVRLGDLAARGAADPRAAVAPFVDALLEARTRVRAERNFALADHLRDRLGAAGVEVRDTPDGVEWELTGNGRVS